jgi:cytochrome c oxidase subunit 2
MLFAEANLIAEQASTFAQEVDALFLFILGITVFFTLLIAGMVIFFIIKYRRRSANEIPPQIEGSLRLEIFWTVIPLAIAMVIFVWSARVYMKWATPPDGSLEVFVVGRQWMWHLQHMGGQREINQLHVPVGQPVKLTITSKDVIHSVFVPQFRLHMDAVPGRYTTAWFQATQTGTFNLFCSQYCGTNHSLMIGQVIVMEPDDYQRWLEARADDSMAVRGRKLFQKLQCVVCHSADSRARGPLLEGIYKSRVTLDDGQVIVADDSYLIESILQPDAKIVDGFRRPSLMPSFQPLIDKGELSHEELLQLLAFLRALGPGQTPPRVESASPPESGQQPGSKGKKKP